MDSVLLSQMTWPDVKQAVASGRLVIVPVGSTEQHGPHLPLDTDIINSFEIAKAAAKKTGAIVAPPLFYGISPHWMAYPGTMTVDQSTFVEFVTEICSSLVKHGFRKIVVLNGHGGNAAAIQLVAQKVVESGGGKCLVAAFSYWDVSSDQINSLRSSPYGGMGHACELETSLQLYLREELVSMNKAVRNLQKKNSEFEPTDLADSRKGILVYSLGGGGQSGDPGESGTMGDPTAASKEKGARFFDAIVAQVTKVLQDLSNR